MATQKTVKQLAIEKGLFRQRGVKRNSSSKNCAFNVGAVRPSPSPSGSVAANASAPDDDRLRFLIVIDFESTCWPDAATERFVGQRAQHPQEIIEFPAVLVDLRTGHVDAENSFHLYVQPEEQPTLSSFCVRLTGISQSTVDGGAPLRSVLPRFNKWLRDLQNKHDFVFEHFANVGETNTTTITTSTGSRLTSSSTPISSHPPPPQQQKPLCSVATWTDWDMGRMLQSECKRKGLRHPPELSAWVDLKLVYKDFYGRKPAGLNGALKDAGIVFEGREHSGIDDAVNTAKLAARMSADGCRIRQTKGLAGIVVRK